MSNNKEVAIFVVAHKKEENSIKERGYHYIGVGKNADNLGYEYKDNIGDNISSKNASFCELTAQYWIWKNVKADYVGLVHYRRFFYNPYISVFKNAILSAKKIEKELNKYDAIVPIQPEIQDSHCTSVYDHYCWQHYQRDIDEVGVVIAQKYPDYLDAFNKLKSSSRFSICNMMITSKAIYDDYSEFLFGVLFELEKRIDISSYNDYQKRIYGFLGERLLNIYLWRHDELKIKYEHVVMIDGKNVFLTYCKKTLRKIVPIKRKVHDYEPIK